MTSTPTEAFANELEQIADRTEGRLRTLQVVTAILLVIVGGYLLFAYSQISKVDAKVMAVNVQKYVEDRLPTFADRAEQTLKDQAPEYIGKLESAALAAPAEVSDRVSEILLDAADEKILELEDEIYTAIIAEVRSAVIQLKDIEGDTEREKMQRLLDDLAAVYGAETIKMIDTFYNDVYKPRAGDTKAYLRKLAAGDDLTPTEMRHRELLEAVMTLQAKWRENPGAFGAELPNVLN